MVRTSLACSVLIVLLSSCYTPNLDATLFEIRKGDVCGIDFRNTIITDDTFNAVSYEYIYNGSGVGIGDFNNDGLQDVFFGGNQVSSELYLNKGKLNFQKVTQEAGVSTHQWVTGVSVIDINGDGLQDIYLSVAGQVPAGRRKNLLFINQGVQNGVPVFLESSRSYGLDDDRYGTMAAFFDYDQDGDADLYLVNNWLEKYNRNNLRPKRVHGEAESTDRLYRNNGNNTFTDVSAEAGITIEGYGLGVAICDINQDNLPDVYVSNDFMSNDLMWINQGDGTFVNKAAEYLKHQTHNGMGVDIADFNNDGLPDILEVDMLPPGHKRQKMMTAGQNYDHFNMSRKLGYESQYMRNTLQLNRGNDQNGSIRFSEIAFMSGVAKTDWSWAPLFADFDNDGWKDVFIGNGYRKDVTNLDFVFFGAGESPFGTPESRKKKYSRELENLEEVKTTNQVFSNNGSLVFQDKTDAWGLNLPTYTNGAAYADLDNDGDLDLITNNIDQEVILYENKLNTRKEQNHFIRIHSSGRSPSHEKIWIYAGGRAQYQELSPYRGYQSTVEPYAHFGVGLHTTVDSVVVRWPDGTVARYLDLPVDTVLHVQPHPSEQWTNQTTIPVPLLLQKIAGPDYVHRENSDSDIKITRTLLHELSRFGPCITSGDVNGDLLDDFFVGGEVGIPARLFIQQADGSFLSSPFTADSSREDGAALLFDADQDNDLDLYIAGASPTSMSMASPHLFYKNDGQGNFSMVDVLPPLDISASCIESADFDGDGDLDLFVGGRMKPAAYPFPPRSYVLRNDHGKFVDVTRQLHPDLESPGLVNTAQWIDVDNDHKPDLVLAGEWMPIRIFKNEGKTFREITKAVGLDRSNGWWNCLRAADINHDGFVDFIAGNTGMNSYFQPTPDQPVQIIAKDFDNNGSIDPIVTYYSVPESERFMVHNRLVVIDQIPGMKKRFETFAQFATTSFEDAFNKKEREGAYVGSAYTLASALFINEQGKHFRTVPLPEIAQLSTVNDILAQDLNHDGHIDLLLIGNNYSQETLFGHYDASIGTVMIGDGQLNWQLSGAGPTQFMADGDAKYLRLLHTNGDPILIITNNNGPLDCHRVPGAR